MKLTRKSGILLHPTSLPGPYGCGDLGTEAYNFVNWLVSARQSLWQMLPLGDIGAGNSPYMSPSAFGGNVLLISLERFRIPLSKRLVSIIRPFRDTGLNA